MRCKMGCNAYRARSRATTSVRCGERLMQIEVHHIKSHVSRTDYSHKRIHIRSIIIKQTSAFMNKRSNLLYILLEQT